MAIAKESAITAAMQTHTNRSNYINAAIRPCIHSRKMMEIEKTMHTWRQQQEKTNPHIHAEIRLHELGMATDWERPKEQPKQQKRDTTPKSPHAPERDKRDREPEL